MVLVLLPRQEELTSFRTTIKARGETVGENIYILIGFSHKLLPLRSADNSIPISERQDKIDRAFLRKELKPCY